jgi:hypothetical protein
MSSISLPRNTRMFSHALYESQYSRFSQAASRHIHLTFIRTCIATSDLLKCPHLLINLISSYEPGVLSLLKYFHSLQFPSFPLNNHHPRLTGCSANLIPLLLACCITGGCVSGEPDLAPSLALGVILSVSSSSLSSAASPPLGLVGL